jgi:hypothetical protein
MTKDQVRDGVLAIRPRGERETKTTVREQLGQGSFSDILPLLREVRRELDGSQGPADDEEMGVEGPALPLVDLPIPDPARVEAILQEIQGEGALQDVLAYASGAVANLELFVQAVPQAARWCHRTGDPRSFGDWHLIPIGFHGGDLERVARALKSFIAEASRRYDMLKGGNHGPAAV